MQATFPYLQASHKLTQKKIENELTLIQILIGYNDSPIHQDPYIFKQMKKNGQNSKESKEKSIFEEMVTFIK